MRYYLRKHKIKKTLNENKIDFTEGLTLLVPELWK